MRFAYADPPYIGQARRHCRNEPSYAGEVDHAALIAELEADYPDGWALSASSPSLSEILPLCPKGTRVGAWVKPMAIIKPGVGVTYAWEPVLFKGGRKRAKGQQYVHDWIRANVTLRRGLTGVKPPEFCYWLFRVLNMQPGDELADLFPGSGAVTRAWEIWQRQPTLWVLA